MKIFDKSIDELLEMMKSDKLSAEELASSYLEEIKKKDRELKAYIRIDSEGALSKAKEIDKKKNEENKLEALAGIPFVVSDDISTKGIKTTANSKMMENYIPPFNATVIEKLYKEDAILMGKSDIKEFGIGQSDNPWGAAVAVANQEAVFALASDTVGEVRQSAAMNGLYGLKPTYGSISRYGLIGSAPSFEQIGIIAKNTRDISKIFKIAKGKDLKDSTSVEDKSQEAALDLTENLKGIKIALPKGYYEELIPETIKEMEKMGATVEEVSLPSLDYALQVYEIISSGEFSSNMGRYDGIAFGYRAEGYKDVDELYKKSRTESFGDDVKKRIIFGNYVLSSGQYKDYYEKAQQIRALISQEVKEIFNKYDLILTPVIGKGTDLKRNYFTVLANVVGAPALSMPAKEDKMGIQLIGPGFSEEKLLTIGAIYSNEKISGGEK